MIFESTTSSLMGKMPNILLNSIPLPKTFIEIKLKLQGFKFVLHKRVQKTFETVRKNKQNFSELVQNFIYCCSNTVRKILPIQNIEQDLVIYFVLTIIT